MSPIDRELERALARRAEPLTPPGDLIDGVERTAGRIRRRRVGMSAAAGLAVLAIGVAIPLSLRRDTAAPPVATQPPGPSPSVSLEPSPTPAPLPTYKVPVYYVGDSTRGPRLFREFRTVPGETAPEAAIIAMLSTKALDPDYVSRWPAGTRLVGYTVEGDTATVDLSTEARANPSVGAEAAEMSYEQLIWTVTAADKDRGVRKVALRVEGQPVDSLWGHVDTRQPRARGDRLDVLANIWIIDPQQGETVKQKLTFSGDATVFESTVSWEVVVQVGCDPEGPITPTSCPRDVAKAGFVNASEGGPGRGTWSVTLNLPDRALEFGSVEIRVWEDSAENGDDLFEDTKSVRVER